MASAVQDILAAHQVFSSQQSAPQIPSTRSIPVNIPRPPTTITIPTPVNTPILSSTVGQLASSLGVTGLVQTVIPSLPLTTAVITSPTLPVTPVVNTNTKTLDPIPDIGRILTTLPEDFVSKLVVKGIVTTTPYLQPVLTPTTEQKQVQDAVTKAVTESATSIGNVTTSIAKTTAKSIEETISLVPTTLSKASEATTNVMNTGALIQGAIGIGALLLLYKHRRFFV
jgi:hypothetical protein